MNKQHIKTTNFDSIYHGSEKRGNLTHGEYVLHNIDIFNEIIIDGKAYPAMYQTACSFDFNDYNYPSSRLELSSEGATSELLTIVNNLYESDFNDEKIIQEIIDEQIIKLCPYINNHERLYDLYTVLNENMPVIDDYLPSEETIFKSLGERKW